MRWWTHHTPGWIRWMHPGRTWKRKTDRNVIYITFDDGPQPVATPFVLSTLNRFNATATFFAVGQQVRQYPALIHEVIAAGHGVANHTYSHLSGWHTRTNDYMVDFHKCEDELARWHNNTPRLFRPPYGRMTQSQARSIGKSHQIVMWGALSGDFDHALDANRARDKLSTGVDNGSIIVFHDNADFLGNLKSLLPWFLHHYSERGYKFERL